MDNQRIKRLLAFSLISIITLCNVQAGSLPVSDDGSGSEPKEVIIKDNPNKKGKPKAPSRQCIECYYFDGCLYFSFLIPEGVCSLEVIDYDSLITSFYTFDSESSDPVYIGSYNKASIIITTSSGHSYYGSLYE